MAHRHIQTAGGGNRGFLNEAQFSLEDFRRAKQEWSGRLLKPAQVTTVRAMTAAVAMQPHQSVVGVGIGEKVTDDKPIGLRAVIFYVNVKYPAGQLGDNGMAPLPKTIDGLPVDVVEAGVFRRRQRRRKSRPRATPQAAAATSPMPNPRTRIRPAQPGCSIGFRDPANQFVMAGTFGAVVRNKEGLCILSNNHVLANEDKLPVGAAIFQPGLLDGGNVPGDQIASLTQAVHLQVNAPNKVDCAIARALDDTQLSNQILYIGAPAGSGDAQIDMIVHKFGRTTSYTVGRVTSIDTDVTVNYDVGQLLFQGQIIIEGLNNQAFSDAGDSGSLILERPTQRAVALLFAGSPSHTIANHISDVLAALNVKLA